MAGGTIVGLDIGSQLMKVVEMKRGGNRIEVTALEVAPTPQEAFQNSEIVDAQMLGKAVKELLNKAKVTARQVVSSVSGSSAVVVRVIEVPQLGDKELAETMRWEVERQVPFNSNQIIMDYKPIDRPEGYQEGQNMDVLLAVAQQGVIDQHVDMLFAAGLKPLAIDVEPLAAGRALLDLSGPAAASDFGRTVAIINLGAANTDVSIFRDKLLVFPRSLPMAGDSLTRAIADALQVDIATAESYKREYGEIILDQMAQPGVYGGDQGGTFGGGAGFVDFSGASDQPPTVGTSSPSGKMPFDFSSPNDTPPPTPDAPVPYDMSGASGPLPSGSFEFDTMPGSIVDQPSSPGFFSTDSGTVIPPENAANLPMPVQSTIDPVRETLRIQVFNAMAPVLAEMVQELRRSLDYYRGRGADMPIHEIVLAGGTARLRNLAPFLEAELGVATRVANPLTDGTVTVSSKQHSEQYAAEVGTLFPVSLGLGSYNLIQAPAAPKKKRK